MLEPYTGRPIHPSENYTDELDFEVKEPEIRTMEEGAVLFARQRSLFNTLFS